jgi:hypothetical protein
VIDFEVINGSVPYEGLAISNQFAPHYGMSFRRSDGKFPFIGMRGFPASAFTVNSVSPALNDQLLPSDPRYNELGNFFLTDDANLDTAVPVYIDFATPVSQVGGYALDIGSQMSITAYSDFGTNIVEVVVVAAGDPGTGDGLSTPWSFNRATNDIQHLRIVMSGADVGAALDGIGSNFVPPPQQLATLSTNRYAGVPVTGEVGRPYRVDYTDGFEPTNWITLTNLFLPASPFLVIDPASTNLPKRFYRAVGTAASGDVLGFETINGAASQEGMSVSNQFELNYGMRFRRSDGGLPVIGRKGVPTVAYGVAQNNPDYNDGIRPVDPRANEFGDFFLSDDGVFNTARQIYLDFVAPVSLVGGYVFDIDSGSEQMTVTAYSDFGTNIVATAVINAGDPETGDGRSTPWSINRPTNDIQHVRIRQSTGATLNVGHDNFFSDYMPPEQLTAALDIHWFAGVTVTGDVGRPYGIQYAEPSAPTHWITLTNIFLPTSPFLLIDTTATNTAARSYRAVSLP